MTPNTPGDSFPPEILHEPFFRLHFRTRADLHMSRWSDSFLITVPAQDFGKILKTKRPNSVDQLLVAALPRWRTADDQINVGGTTWLPPNFHKLPRL